jgi:uncharacterized protein YceK
MNKFSPRLAVAVLCSGCASIFSGTTQEVSIRTTPGARYSISTVNGSQIAAGESAGTVQLQRGVGYFSPHAYKAKISKEGYQTKIVDITPGINPWYFANILLGGVVGMVIVDPLTGAMFNLNPSMIDTQLDPLPDGAAPNAAPRPMENQVTGQRQARLQRPVSRFDYTASRLAKDKQCLAKDSPEVGDYGKAVETLTFDCQDGRRLTITCASLEGCR